VIFYDRFDKAGEIDLEAESGIFLADGIFFSEVN
jgi:hypothetical protein